MSERFYLVKDVVDFLKRTKKWWIVPLVCVLFLIGLLIWAGSVSPVSIFVYPLV